MPYADRQQLRDYQRSWCRSRRASFLDDKVCSDCGSSSDLEIHHVDPARKVSHSIWSWGERRRVTELAKCVVLCLDCHRKHTAAYRRMVAELKHPCGTRQSYWRGCRCQPCRDAKAAYVRSRNEELAA